MSARVCVCSAASPSRPASSPSLVCNVQRRFDGSVAQMVERSLSMRQVQGSMPCISTLFIFCLWRAGRGAGTRPGKGVCCGAFRGQCVPLRVSRSLFFAVAPPPPRISDRSSPLHTRLGPRRCTGQPIQRRLSANCPGCIDLHAPECERQKKHHGPSRARSRVSVTHPLAV